MNFRRAGQPPDREACRDGRDSGGIGGFAPAIGLWQCHSWTSLTLPLTLTNSSSGTLSLSAFNLSSNYTQTNDCNGSLGPGATCTVNVTLTPSALGDQSGSLSIDFSGNGSPQVISLSGTAITALEISPQQLTFGQQDVGVASSPQTVSMGNAGAVPLTVSSVSISGDFQLLDNSCPTTLAASFYCTMEVEFTPTAVGSRSGTLTVIASDFESTHVVLLSGTGVVVPIVGLSPTSLTFAGQLVGVASGAQAVTLSNTGSAALSLTSIAASGDFTGNQQLRHKPCGECHVQHRCHVYAHGGWNSFGVDHFDGQCRRQPSDGHAYGSGRGFRHCHGLGFFHHVHRYAGPNGHL